MRLAFRFTALICRIRFFSLGSAFPASLIKPIEEGGVSLRYFRVRVQTNVDPTANPIAVVQVRMTDVTVSNLRFVITTARTHAAHPAGVTLRFTGQVRAP